MFMKRSGGMMNNDTFTGCPHFTTLFLLTTCFTKRTQMPGVPYLHIS